MSDAEISTPRPPARIRVRLGLLAFTTAVVIQSGGLDVIDARNRLHTAHALWAGGDHTRATEGDLLPSVVPFGLPGRGGKAYPWYGIGQSLVMIPADMVATAAARVLKLPERKEDVFRQFVVSYLTFPWITAASIVVAFGVLLELGFTPRRAVCGAVALLFGTSVLQYAKHHQENSLILLMLLCGTYGGLVWRRTDAMRPLVLGMIALGFNLLIRLTTLLDFAAVSALILGLVWHRGRRRGEPVFPRVARYCLVAFLASAAFLLLDRLYHFARFATWTDTYYTRVTPHWRSYIPSLPVNWPYNGDFSIGFLGPLISPQKSIFLFDPLLALALLGLALGGRRLRAEVWGWFAVFAALLMAYIYLYARVIFWGGDVAWGDRYVLTSVWMLALVGVPLLMELWSTLAPPWRVLGSALIATSVAIQLASVVMGPPVECAQRNARGDDFMTVYRGPGFFVVGHRFLNIARRLAGPPEGRPMTPDERAVQQFGQINLTPFRLGEEAYRSLVPPKVQRAVVVAWLLLVLAVIAQVVSLLRPTSPGQRRGVSS
jgi:hypothetical protein